VSKIEEFVCKKMNGVVKVYTITCMNCIDIIKHLFREINLANHIVHSIKNVYIFLIKIIKKKTFLIAFNFCYVNFIFSKKVTFNEISFFYKFFYFKFHFKYFNYYFYIY